MFTIKTEVRSKDKKPNQLRREGIIPGILYGRSLESPISIQFSESEVTRLLKNNTAGSKVELNINGEKHISLLREVDYTPASNKVEHLSFQALQADEVIESVAMIVFENRDNLKGLLQQSLSEVTYRALPKYMVDRIEIDLDGLEIGDTIRVGDLELAKDPNVELINDPDTVIATVLDSTPVMDQDADDQDTLDEGSSTDASTATGDETEA